MTSIDTISYTCTACGHTADFPKAQEGKAVYCPKCQAAQVIKRPGTDRIDVERIPTGRIVKAEQAPATDRIEKPHGMAGTARIDFTCGACNHVSRISAALSGQPVRCPMCGTVQLAGVAGLRVVRLDGTGKLPFTCTACNYQAKLNPDYSGKAIRCPKCQGAQVVPRLLRDPSGAYQALPAADAAAKPAEAAKRPTTGSFSKPAPRSEPSPALRTPAGGIPVTSPMPTPTPLPGSLSTPLPGSLTTPLPGSLSTPPPGALSTPPPEAPAAAPAATDDAGHLDLGETPAAAAPEDAVKPRAGSVVRRSGRMAVQSRTPKPGDEPTLEPARAVQPEPDGDAVAEAAKPRAQAAVAKAPARPSESAPDKSGQPAWLVPVLGVGLAVAVISAIVLVVMLNAESGRAASLQSQLSESQKTEASTRGDLAATRQKLSESEAATAAAAKERDEAKERIEAQRREQDALKSETDRLKTEVERLKGELAAKQAEKASAPSGKPERK